MRRFDNSGRKRVTIPGGMFTFCHGAAEMMPFVKAQVESREAKTPAGSLCH